MRNRRSEIFKDDIVSLRFAVRRGVERYQNDELEFKKRHNREDNIKMSRIDLKLGEVNDLNNLTLISVPALGFSSMKSRLLSGTNSPITIVPISHQCVKSPIARILCHLGQILANNSSSRVL